MEAIINNWTTTYLTKHLSIEERSALYALSLYVVGMTVMRLLLGSILHSIKLAKLMLTSFSIILIGILLIHFGQTFYFSVAGLILLGIGLAAGFPIMLGLAGEKYSAQSGTAFGFIFTIALFGNMLVNYLMGWIAKKYGIHHYTHFVFIELAFMLLFCLLILKEQNKKILSPK